MQRSKRQQWVARFEVFNRTIYDDEEGKRYVSYSLLTPGAGINVGLVNYTEYSAVYSIKPEGRLVEYVIKV
jgi:hypothetical protein